MIYFISDHHFDHGKIIQYCNRPFNTVQEMNEYLIEKHNETVQKTDTVFFLGDFGYLGVRRGKEILDRLNGYKILVLGNHDENIGRMKRMGFDEVYEKDYSLEYGYLRFKLCHYPYRTLINYYYAMIKYVKYWISKYSIKDKKVRSKHIRKLNDYLKGVFKESPKRTYEDWLISGHVHNSKPFINRRKKIINVSADVLNFTPISILDIMERIGL